MLFVLPCSVFSQTLRFTLCFPAQMTLYLCHWVVWFCPGLLEVLLVCLLLQQLACWSNCCDCFMVYYPFLLVQWTMWRRAKVCHRWTNPAGTPRATGHTSTSCSRKWRGNQSPRYTNHLIHYSRQPELWLTLRLAPTSAFGRHWKRWRLHDKYAQGDSH